MTPSAVEVRVLRTGDEHVLEHVAPDVFDDPLDAAATRAFLADPGHHLAVAIEGDVVVGFASALSYAHPDKPRPEMWVNEVGVAPTHQRRGIARSLLDALLGVARGLGCREVWVLTDRDNTAAMKLYEALRGERAQREQVMWTFRI